MMDAEAIMREYHKRITPTDAQLIHDAGELLAIALNGDVSLNHKQRLALARAASNLADYADLERRALAGV